MSEIDELIAVTERLCNRLDEAAANERKFCGAICEELERISWESLRMTNELKQIKEYQGF